MREILFRGKEHEENEDKNRWTNGYFYKNDEGRCFIAVPDGGCVHSYRIIPETAGEYTGLDDKNGVKIFEGGCCSLGDRKGVLYWHSRVEKRRLQCR
jgi:hypothetical protein